MIVKWREDCDHPVYGKNTWDYQVVLNVYGFKMNILVNSFLTFIKHVCAI